MTTNASLVVEKHYERTMRSWTSSGSTRLRGTASRTFAAPRMFSPPPRFKFALQQSQHAILRAITHQGPSSLAPEPAWKALVLSSWLLKDDPLSMLRRATVRTFWKPDLTYSGRKIGQLSGPWCVQGVTLHQSSVQSAELLQNRNSHASAKWRRWLDQVSGAAP